MANLYLSGDAKLYDNTASAYAPGIYNNGNLYVEGGIQIEDGVYFETRSSVIQLTNPLMQDTIIQLNPSDYVVADETKAPIVVAEATPTYQTLTTFDLQHIQKPTEGFTNWELQLSEDQTKIVLVPMEVEEYTITYYNLHGATHTNPTTYTSETPTITLTPPTPVKCYYFLGWVNQSGVRVTEIPKGSVGDLVFIASWDFLGCHEKIGYVCIPEKKPCGWNQS